MISCADVIIFVIAVCYLPPVKGHCDTPVTRWHYDTDVGKCKKFVYGGCAGNNNNFVTEASCINFCRPSPSDQIGT